MEMNIDDMSTDTIRKYLEKREKKENLTLVEELIIYPERFESYNSNGKWDEFYPMLDFYREYKCVGYGYEGMVDEENGFLVFSKYDDDSSFSELVRRVKD